MALNSMPFCTGIFISSGLKVLTSHRCSLEPRFSRAVTTNKGPCDEVAHGDEGHAAIDVQLPRRLRLGRVEAVALDDHFVRMNDQQRVGAGSEATVIAAGRDVAGDLGLAKVEDRQLGIATSAKRPGIDRRRPRTRHRKPPAT